MVDVQSGIVSSFTAYIIIKINRHAAYARCVRMTFLPSVMHRLSRKGHISTSRRNEFNSTATYGSSKSNSLSFVFIDRRSALISSDTISTIDHCPLSRPTNVTHVTWLALSNVFNSGRTLLLV